MIRRLIVEGYSHRGKPTRVTLRFDEKGHLLNPGAAAANSMVGWGPWQSSEKVPSHWGACWWVSTAGHGGYILVTFIKDLPFKGPALKVEQPSLDPVYVYEFEEDCDWAILEYRDEMVRRHALAKRNGWRAERGEPPRTEAEYLAECILPCLQRWNPTMLRTADQPVSAT
jgi:hypothetical protein